MEDDGKDRLDEKRDKWKSIGKGLWEEKTATNYERKEEELRRECLLTEAMEGYISGRDWEEEEDIRYKILDDIERSAKYINLKRMAEDTRKFRATTW